MERFLPLFLVFFPMAASLAVFPIGRRSGRGLDLYIRGVPFLVLAGALALLACPRAGAALAGVCGLGLGFQAGSLGSLLVLVSALLWVGTGLASPEYFAGAEHRQRYYAFWLATQGALMGVFLASDLYTLFVFFEIMSFSSYVWVAQNETPAALGAGRTYLVVAVIGGMTLLVGLFLLFDLFGTLEFSALPGLSAALPPQRRLELAVAGGCCLFGFGAKAGMFPLHIWLPKAHPVAPAPASALLSGILTKSGVFGILVVARYLFAGDRAWSDAVLLLGTVTMVLGAVLALFSIDLKRTLACSSMSQIGFVLVGVAMQGYLDGENALAAWGTVLHMLNHSLIKLVLFVAAGVIYLGGHTLNLNELRGWGRDKPWLKTLFFVGACAIAGVPGFSGYVSKTLLHESIVEYIHALNHAGADAGIFQAVEWLFLLSGGLTAAYMTKLFVCLFVSPARKAKGRKTPRGTPYMSRAAGVGLSCAAAGLVVMGLTPGLTMQPLARWAGTFLRADGLEGAVAYFSLTNLKGACVSLAIGAAVYLLIVRGALMKKSKGGVQYLDRWPRDADLEEQVYLPLLRGLSFLGAFCARTAASVGDLFVLVGERILFTNAPGIFVPGHDENFGTYDEKPRRFLVSETFSFDLLLAGTGLVAMLLYILLV